MSESAMQSAVLELRGQDGPGQFKAVLESFLFDTTTRRWREEAQRARVALGWIRAVGERGGFGVRLEAADISPYLTPAYQEGLQRAIESQTSNRTDRPPLVRAKVYPANSNPPWQNGRVPLVFSLRLKPDTDRLRVITFLEHIAEVGIDIAQHETLRSGDDLIQLFRVYGNSGQVKSNLQHVIENQFNESMRGGGWANDANDPARRAAQHAGRDPLLRFGSPTSTQLLDWMRDARNPRHADFQAHLFTVYAEDRPGIFAAGLRTINQHGWQVIRSCCRGISPRGTLMFVANPLRQTGALGPDELCERLARVIRVDLSNSVHHRLCPGADDVMNGGATQERLVILNLRFSGNQPGMILGILNGLDSSSIIGSVSVVLFDGQPLPEDPKIFACRIGFSVPRQRDFRASQILARLSSHLTSDRWAENLRQVEIAIDE